MYVRILIGALTAAAMAAPAFAEMNADEARKFVHGKVFAFTCFDGTRGAGRVFEDGSAAGSVQFSGSGPTRYMRLPGNTLQVRGQSVCASLKGIPFEPCFNLNKQDDRSFRGSVSGLSFAYCDFRQQGASPMLVARANARPRARLQRTSYRSADATPTEVASRVETPRVEATRLEPVRAVATPADAAPELRRTTD